MDGDYKDDNCDGAMDDYDDYDDDNVDGDGAIVDNSDDNVVANWACTLATAMTLAAHPLSWQGAG